MTTQIESLASELGRQVVRIERDLRQMFAASLAEIRAEAAGLRAQAAEADARALRAERDLTAAVTARLDAVRDGDSVTVADMLPAIEECVARVVGALPPPEPGANADIDVVQREIAEHVAAGLVDAVATLRSALDDSATAIPDLVDAAVLAALAPAVERAVGDVVPDAVTAAVSRAVADLPEPRNGQDVDMAVVASMIEERVIALTSSIPADIDGSVETAVDAFEVRLNARATEIADAVVPAVTRAVDAAFASVPDMVARLASEAAHGAVAALPVPRDGEDVDIDVVREMVADMVAALPPPQQGEPGPAGALPEVREWVDEVHYRAAVVTHDGAIYQAVRDTGRAPPAEDWRCLVPAAQPGAPGRSLAVRGTWSKDVAYAALDIVAWNGGSSVALVDAPGECPGPDWQMLTSPGKRGRAAPKVVSASVDDEGLVTFTMQDSETFTLDLYSVLSAMQGDR